MNSRFILTVPLLTTILIFSNAKLLGIEEGSRCNGGTCKLLSECTAPIDFRKVRPDICNFQGKVPIICCPEEAITKISSSESESTTSTTEATVVPIIKVGSDFDSSTSSETSEVGAIARRKCLQYSAKTCHRIPQIFKAKRQVKWEYYPVVVGGISSKPRELIFMALIGYGEKGSQEWDCGGSLISDYWVLSAAHCKASRLGEAKWIRLGELDIETDKDDARPIDIPIAESVIHPEYGPDPAIYNDIALFKSKYKIHFNDYVRPICLETYLPNISIKPMAAGWGTIAFGGQRSSSLQQVELNFVRTQNCSAQYGKSKLLPSGINPHSQICVGIPGKDTCAGDSGGPLFQNYDSLCLKYQIGITSFGRKCGVLPGVYTWVLNYIEWIEKIVWSNEENEDSKFEFFI